MIKISNKNKCSGCHACYSVCPKSCITMKKDNEGFLYPFVETTKCVGCGLCEKVCPYLNSKIIPEDKIKENVMAFKCKDSNARISSSSGGAFKLLAQEILNKGGTVVGAAFSSDFSRVEHIEVSDAENLSSLTSSKYLQSEIKSAYLTTKKLLEEKVIVLFSGTPCQIAGLRHFLQKNYENLYCVDLACHGVPSSKLWNKYLDDIKIKNKCEIKGVNFRCKKYGWANYGVSIVTNKKELFILKDEDPYMQMFLNNLSLRPSCYECLFKGNSYESDITIGDFWGIKNISTKMNDCKGVSIVIVRTNKGKQLIQAVNNKANILIVNKEKAIKYNPSILKSAPLPLKRDVFFRDMNIMRFDSLAKCYCKNRGIKKYIKSTWIWKRVILPIYTRLICA